MISSDDKTKTQGSAMTWKCTVCGFIFTGEKPPKGCPNCHSPSGEFIHEKEHVPFVYDGEPFEVLLINGSTHRAGNTSVMTEVAEEVLREKGVTYRRFNLSEYRIDNCWCCYAVRAQSCDYPCRNPNDDMHVFHQMLAAQRLATTPAHQRGPLQATARLMAEYPVAGAVPSLVHWLHHDIQSVQETVRKALVRVTKGNVGWLIENFEVESHAKRSVLAGLVADEFGAAAVPDLVKAARDKSPRMRQGATWALACIGGPEAVEVVRQGLKDEHPQVRSAAAWGVGRLGKRDLADALVALLADGDPAPRSMAVEQLGALF